MSSGCGELTLSLLDFFDSSLYLVPAFLCLFDRHASLFQAISNHQEINLYIRVLLEAEWLHLIVQLVEHEEDVGEVTQLGAPVWPVVITQALNHQSHLQNMLLVVDCILHLAPHTH